MNKQDQENGKHSFNSNETESTTTTTTPTTPTATSGSSAATISKLVNSNSQFLNVINEEAGNHVRHGSLVSIVTPHRTSMSKMASDGATSLLMSIKNTIASKPSPPPQPDDDDDDNEDDEDDAEDVDIEFMAYNKNNNNSSRGHRKSIFEKLKLIRKNRKKQRVGQESGVVNYENGEEDEDDDEDDYEYEENTDNGTPPPPPPPPLAPSLSPHRLIKFHNDEYEDDEEALVENDNLNSICDLDEEVFSQSKPNEAVIHLAAGKGNVSLKASKRKSSGSFTKTPPTPKLVAHKPSLQLQPIKTILSNSNSNLGKLRSKNLFHSILDALH